MQASAARRLFLGGTVGVLVAAPFVIRNIRRKKQLQGNSVKTFKAKRDTSIVPSGWIDVICDYLAFEPLKLPDRQVRHETLNATLSNDKKWVIVSYCVDDDCQAKICYAPVDKLGLSEAFVELENFGPQSVVAELGCSSLTNRGGRLSYRLRKREEGEDACSMSLSCVSLQQREKKLEISSEPLLLEKKEFQMKNWAPSGVGGRNHCWLDAQDAFVALQGPYVAGQGASLVRADCGTVSGDRFHVLRLLQPRTIVNSNLFLDGKTINFSETPVQFEKPSPQAPSSQKTIVSPSASKDAKASPPLDPLQDPLLTPYKTAVGSFVKLGFEGAVRQEKPFAIPPFPRMILITKTHCFFPSAPSGGRFFLMATLDRPQEYTSLPIVLRDQVLDAPDKADRVVYMYNPLAILPSGRHLLCSCFVATDFIANAIKRKIPLTQLGIFEIPFKMG